MTGEGRGVAGKWMEFGKYRCTVVHPVFVKDVEGLLALSQGHATIGAFPNPRAKKSDTQFLPLQFLCPTPANLPVLLSIRYPMPVPCASWDLPSSTVWLLLIRRTGKKGHADLC